MLKRILMEHIFPSLNSNLRANNLDGFTGLMVFSQVLIGLGNENKVIDGEEKSLANRNFKRVRLL